ncbi:ArsR/SmtB family transcription factor [Sutcliffiella rhizosphaerae]|uniref:HTH-type transcriptional regulator n=1 Tax=Sutcliffiella rhizosphaerae TaxID=2880967 RepID=A0ABN8A8Y1_9BACI|nr:metalloregulator ArsR/SmtB family transcription factor [Sutcliffiella rhizosphaerae]CAG9621615.1 HTH-type transcriptional regulator [Sutcliffiella rhizosphaerae]
MNQTSQKHDAFQAIADSTRRSILHLLSERELAISDIAKEFPISRTAVTKHLVILSEASLVSSRKVGREKRYRLMPDGLTEIHEFLSYYEKFWSNKLLKLKYISEKE